jgi:hypothetical protein
MGILDSMKMDLLKGKTLNIVFIGDSITSTEWVHPNWREIIEYVLKEELTNLIGVDNWKIPSWSIRCFNFGFDGSTTTDILDRINTILDLNPYMAICLENTNEIHYDFTPLKHKKNVETLLGKLSEVCSYILYASSICGNNKRYNDSLSKYPEIIKTIKFDRKTIFINAFDEYAKYNLSKFFTFKSMGNDALGLKSGDIDFVHPNQLGNAYIAKIILKKGFGIEFNPEKYVSSTLNGDMYPSY